MSAVLIDRPETTAMDDAPRPEWHYTRELTLAAVPSAVTMAHLLVRHALDGLDQAVIETADDLLRDLVVHAVATTGLADPPPTYSAAWEQVPLIYVRLDLLPEQVGLATRDIALVEPAAEFGLAQVAARSSRWGHFHPPHGGRVIWCEISTVSAGAVNAVQIPAVLPKRTPQPVPPPLQSFEAQHDTAVIERVLDGLKSMHQREGRDT
jgi:hypothetical protein